MIVAIAQRPADKASSSDEGRLGDPQLPSWCSLYEGDGVSDPSAEGWDVRPFGGTTITAGFSDGATVAMVNDPTSANGAWMQRFMDFEQPFVISVRGRYDPSSSFSDFVTLLDVFTGNHSMGVSLYPTHMYIGAVPPIDLPAVKGTWYNVTFDARAPLDVDVLVDGVLVGNVEMYPIDLIIWDQPLNKPGLYAIGTGLDQTAAGMVDYIRTTMCPPNEIPPKHPDRIPPEIRNVTFDDGIQQPANVLTVPMGTSKVWLNATIDDSRTKNSTIWSVNYSKMPRTWPGTRMYPVDGKLDWPVEDVTALIDISSFPLGSYDYCVYARDYQGPKNLTGGCGTLIIAEVFHFNVNVSYSNPDCREGTCYVHLEIDTDDTTLIFFRWDFNDDGSWDTAWLTSKSYDWSPYGDSYQGRVCAQGADGTGRLANSCADYEVKNVPPSIVGIETFMLANVTLRVAGEKWHDVALVLFENGTAVGWAQVIRQPGSPDRQAVTVHGVKLSPDRNLSAIVYYTPDDDKVNGQPNGANPVWLIISWENGRETRLHHTFNVKHPGTWVWTVDSLRIFAVNQTMHFTATATDPGSDDLTFTWDWGDGTPATATTHFNDGAGPDPPYSPGGTYPFTATDSQTHAYSSAGAYTVTLKVSDDDGGTSEMTFDIIIGG